MIDDIFFFVDENGKTIASHCSTLEVHRRNEAEQKARHLAWEAGAPARRKAARELWIARVVKGVIVGIFALLALALACLVAG